jgi:hypothetical protein
MGSPEGRRRGVFQLSIQSPRLRAANHLFFGYVGGRHNERLKVSELDVTRGESSVWDMSARTLEFGSVGCPLTFLEVC